MATATPTIAARSTKTAAPKSADLLAAIRVAVADLDTLRKAKTAWTRYATARIAARVANTVEPGEPPVAALDVDIDNAVASIAVVEAMSGTRLTTADAALFKLNSESNGPAVAFHLKSEIAGSSTSTMKAIRAGLKG